MTTRTDLGSYAVQDPPFDTYGTTKVPLRTPRGPVTLTLTGAGHIAVDAGYVTTDYEHATNYSGGEGFAVDNIEIAGSADFWLGSDGQWTTTPPPDHAGDPHLYGLGGGVTPRREADVLAYWGEIVRRYTAEHPHVPAHAGLRAAVSDLTRQGEEITKAEEALRELRAERARIRRSVRQALAASYRTGGPDSPDNPRPYYNEPVNGYVVTLVNDRDFMVAAGAAQPRQ